MAGSCHSLLIFSVCTGAAVTVLSMLHNGVEAHPNATPRQPTCCTKSSKGLCNGVAWAWADRARGVALAVKWRGTVAIRRCVRFSHSPQG